VKTHYSAGDLDHILSCEGLDYAIKHYVDPTNISDINLRSLWESARDSLTALEQYITKKCELGA
jgi:hypothetical protein